MRIAIYDLKNKDVMDSEDERDYDVYFGKDDEMSDEEAERIVNETVNNDDDDNNPIRVAKREIVKRVEGKKPFSINYARYDPIQLPETPVNLPLSYFITEREQYDIVETALNTKFTRVDHLDKVSDDILREKLTNLSDAEWDKDTAEYRFVKYAKRRLGLRRLVDE